MPEDPYSKKGITEWMKAKVKPRPRPAAGQALQRLVQVAQQRR